MGRFNNLQNTKKFYCSSRNEVNIFDDNHDNDHDEEEGEDEDHSLFTNIEITNHFIFIYFFSIIFLNHQEIMY